MSFTWIKTAYKKVSHEFKSKENDDFNLSSSSGIGYAYLTPFLR